MYNITFVHLLSTYYTHIWNGIQYNNNNNKLYIMYNVLWTTLNTTLQGHRERESREMARNKGTKLTRRRRFVNVLFLERHPPSTFRSIAWHRRERVNFIITFQRLLRKFRAAPPPEELCSPQITRDTTYSFVNARGCIIAMYVA